jgi:hypothetical protein
MLREQEYSSTYRRLSGMFSFRIYYKTAWTLGETPVCCKAAAYTQDNTNRNDKVIQDDSKLLSVFPWPIIFKPERIK